MFTRSRFVVLLLLSVLFASSARAQFLPSDDCNGNFKLDTAELEAGSEEDCDRDARPDICALQPSGYQFHGVTRVPQNITTANAFARGAKLADINGDGRIDVLAVYPGAEPDDLKRLKVFLANSEGVLVESSDIELAENFTPLVTLNGLFGVDVIAGSLYFQNDGSGGFTKNMLSDFDGMIVGTTDFSGDNLDDLIVTYPSSQSAPSSLNLGVLVNQGSGMFSAVNFIYGVLEEQFSFDLEDLNGDGYSDVVIATPGLGETELGVVLGGPDGNVSRSTIVFIYGVSANGVKIGDVDQSGGKDIILTTPEQVHVLSDFDIGGSNSGYPKLVGRSSCANPDLIDINGDGSLDLICNRFVIPTSCCREIYRSYILNDGSGSFFFAGYEPFYSTRTLIPTLLLDEVFIDVTADGRPDSIALFESGTLSERTVYLQVSEQANSTLEFPTGLDKNGDFQPDSCGTDGLNFTRYSQWNSYLDLTNIAELRNLNREPLTLQVNLRDSSGSIAESIEFSLAAGQEFDLILNEFPLLQTAGYGIVEVRSSAEVSGGVSYYRGTPNASRAKAGFDTGDFDFAFQIPFTVPFYSPKTFLFNSFQPSAHPKDTSVPVYNWLTIVNLSRETKVFNVESQFDGSADAIGRTAVAAEFGRVDIDGGHGFGEGFNRGFHSVTTADERTPYLAMLTRYGATFDPNRFSFAFPSFASQQTSLVSTGGAASTWLEVANALNKELLLLAVLYDNSGSQIHQEELRLSPNENSHYLINNWIGDNATANLDLRLLSGIGTYHSQVVSYFYSPTTGAVETAYLSVSTPLRGEQRFASYNLYLGTYNWLRILNNASIGGEVFGEIFSPEGRGNSLEFFGATIPSRGLVEFDIHNSSRFGTTQNTYGLIDLALPSNAVVSADLLRVKPTTSGGFDFIFHTSVK